MQVSPLTAILKRINPTLAKASLPSDLTTQPTQPMDSSTSPNPLIAMDNRMSSEIQPKVTGNINPDIKALIQKYFPKDQWDNAEKVVQAESGGDPSAVGDNYPIDGQVIPSVGLFQIRTLPGRPDAQTLMDPETNVAYAAQMQKEQGWGPWSTAHTLGIVKE